MSFGRRVIVAFVLLCIAASLCLCLTLPLSISLSLVCTCTLLPSLCNTCKVWHTCKHTRTVGLCPALRDECCCCCYCYCCGHPPGAATTIRWPNRQMPRFHVYCYCCYCCCCRAESYVSKCVLITDNDNNNVSGASAYKWDLFGVVVFQPDRQKSKRKESEIERKCEGQRWSILTVCTAQFA